jgi:hypothetical protein
MASKHAGGEEAARLHAASQGWPWRKWGPYLSERQWGTVREDYSARGDAWNYFPHDHARSRTYHWGEDGLAGFSDEQGRLCFALALWNGHDPILKERLFGLTNTEGNHGEDVKEYYFYLDSTPTHSYMKWLYKYPQQAYPYDRLVQINRRRTRHEQEYELIDTGVFDDDKYFDVFVEYAKAEAEEILIRITAVNRGGTSARLHVLPTLWFRNTWWPTPYATKPVLREVERGCRAIAASHPDLGQRWLYVEDTPPLLFTENETNNEALFGGPNVSPYVKDAFDNCIVHGRADAVNPNQSGTKAAAHFDVSIGPGESVVFRLRLSAAAPETFADPFVHFDQIVATRMHEADEFYAAITPPSLGTDAAHVLRQALAGMLWSKQYYYFDLQKWLADRGVEPSLEAAHDVRNAEWSHMENADVISMPDKWEYPWYAAWDLAFHAIALASVDVEFAKSQLELMLRERYIHPSGQIPAYEWNFSDVNPPVHAWATIFLHRNEQVLRGHGDIDFLKRSFGKLLSNFAWWASRKDRFGRNVFEGGFFGLDNIGVFDRVVPLPEGWHLEQADGTAWMALFCQNMLEIATEIAAVDPAFEDLAVKFVDHLLAIAGVLNRPGPEGMWDEEDGFYYDVLRAPDGRATRVRVRSIVGLLPLCATTVVEADQRLRVPKLEARFHECVNRTPQLLHCMHPTGEGRYGCHDRGILAVLAPDRLRRLLMRMLDEREFLSPYGIRTLSRVHLDHPYLFRVPPHTFHVSYAPAESDTAIFGGNANWRGPVWMPLNVVLIRGLLQFYAYYGDAFTIECPTGSGRMMNLFDIAQEIAMRLTRIFQRDERGRRPVFGGTEKLQRDPHFRDYLLFYEYFHGDNGAGLGASHQTGWTGLVATLLQLFATLSASDALEGGAHVLHRRMQQAMEREETRAES